MAPTHRLKLLVKKRSDDSGRLRQHLNGMSFTSIMSGQLPPSVVGKPSSSEDTVTISVALLEAQMGERSRRPRSVASHGGDHSPPPCAATCATPSLEAPSGISAPPGLPVQRSVGQRVKRVQMMCDGTHCSDEVQFSVREEILREKTQRLYQRSD